MAVSMGSTGKTSLSEINMTPMIDVLLVLLVIFMVAQPQMQKALDMQIPKDENTPNAINVPRIVLEIDANGRIAINTEVVAPGQLENRLRAIFAGRDDKMLFVKPTDDAPYQSVISAMDAARGAGVTVLGAVI